MTFSLLLCSASVVSQREGDIPSCTPTAPLLPAFHFRDLNGINFFPFNVLNCSWKDELMRRHGTIEALLGTEMASEGLTDGFTMPVLLLCHL